MLRHDPQTACDFNDQGVEDLLAEVDAYEGELDERGLPPAAVLEEIARRYEDSPFFVRRAFTSRGERMQRKTTRRFQVGWLPREDDFVLDGAAKGMSWVELAEGLCELACNIERGLRRNERSARRRFGELRKKGVEPRCASVGTKEG